MENKKTLENYDFNYLKLNVHHAIFFHLTFENVKQCMDGHLDYGLHYKIVT